MGQKIFIPVTDELLFDRPDLISAPLQPFTEDMPCYHWMDVSINPQDDERIAEKFNARKQARASRKIELPRVIAA